jgi:hypothetical protein
MEYKKKLREIKKELKKREKKVIIRAKPVEELDYFDIDSCLCTDSRNRFKKLYLSEKEAEKVAKFLFDEQGIFLMVYPCRYSSGWHLSRR